MDAYASVGMPVNYRHWSYGKEFIANERSYRRGQMGLAYEIVINSDPCISYLMEENTTAMQALVIAHAAYGHNSFFKGNYLFRLWTDASSIIDYLVYARNYIAECEEKHGMQAVEDILDSCHALQNYGVDRYHRPSKISLVEERRAATSASPTRRRRSTTSGAPCRAASSAPARGRRAEALPERAAGKHPLLHREERAAARAVAARGGAHRAQDRAVLLSAAADPGHERRLGHVLASPRCSTRSMTRATSPTA